MDLFSYAPGVLSQYSDTVISFDSVHQAKFQQNLLQALLGHGLGYGKHSVAANRLLKAAVFIRLLGSQGVFDLRFVVDLGPLGHVVSGDSGLSPTNGQRYNRLPSWPQRITPTKVYSQYLI